MDLGFCGGARVSLVLEFCKVLAPIHPVKVIYFESGDRNRSVEGLGQVRKVVISCSSYHPTVLSDSNSPLTSLSSLHILCELSDPGFRPQIDSHPFSSQRSSPFFGLPLRFNL
ncbi:hypothetical protein E1B28_011702 [Marasmius oreades]|uniref:Uncharacterized protein n=1 Tax=Marasmius oreades TaxID=181124 RepID=A0A9P7RVC3_9AGAR|nr:uncharacterized protein E1B28_011702 [Marasmius oreades]KAG7090085.1 hypothetical protein E1B28_011702 [Marasmius oreades]